ISGNAARTRVAEAERVGILGTVTGFGSVCLNGVEVAYDEATPVSESGTAVAATKLVRGMTVAVTAIETTGHLAAGAIEIAPAVMGPVTAVESPGAFAVMGVRVEIPPTESPQTLSVGAIVSVHGLQRNDGVIDATQIAAIETQTVLVRGVAQS